jgi:hypothetical protein
MFNLNLIGETSIQNLTITEMWNSCYDGNEEGLVAMMKDWLMYHQERENYQTCSLIHNWMVSNGYDVDLSNHDRRTFDMMALYEVSKEVVEIDNYSNDF